MLTVLSYLGGVFNLNIPQQALLLAGNIALVGGLLWTLAVQRRGYRQNFLRLHPEFKTYRCAWRLQRLLAQAKREGATFSEQRRASWAEQVETCLLEWDEYQHACYRIDLPPSPSFDDRLRILTNRLDQVAFESESD